MYLLSEDVLPFIQKHLISVYTELFMEIFSILENSPSFSTFYSASTIEDKGGEFYSGLEMFPFFVANSNKIVFQTVMLKDRFHLNLFGILWVVDIQSRMSWSQSWAITGRLTWKFFTVFRFFYKYKKEQSPGK